MTEKKGPYRTCGCRWQNGDPLVCDHKTIVPGEFFDRLMDDRKCCCCDGDATAGRDTAEGRYCAKCLAEGWDHRGL